MATRPLRRQLFRSHLTVMVVAMGVLIAGVVVIGSVLSILTDGWFDFDRELSGGKGRDPGPFGPVALLGVIGAAVIAATLVGWRMAGRLATPMEALGQATREIATGNYDVDVDATDITELDRLGADVRAMADALEEVETRRLRLIGDIAHELRTPLSTIEGSMEALMDGVVPADDETFAGIAREAARLRRLAGDLSALSSSAEQDPLAEGGPVDVGQLATSVVELLRVQAEAKDVGLTAHTGEGPAVVVGDPDRLTQVLTNIIGNAIQYTDKGAVDVRVRVEEPNVVVEVDDSGRGLSDDDQRRVFERFYRVDEHFADGTGVGLTIAQQIVWAHRGSLTAHSDGEGTGTTFTITLPTA